MSTHAPVKKITTQYIQALKAQGEKSAMLTVYDYTMAKILDAAGIDMLLVGDSAANVMAGYSTTIPISLDHMILYSASVARAVQRALLVTDMPFGTYQGSVSQAFNNAVRLMQQGGAHALKLEGGEEIVPAVSTLTQAGIPVMGHLGLTPQSIFKFGTFALRAKEDAEAEKLMADAIALQNAGCFALVLEKIPADLAARVTRQLNIPTIGIGAGSQCDGQVLVMQDMLGLNKDFQPKFVRRYLQLHQQVEDAVKQYVSDVKAGTFPNQSEQY